MKRKFGYILSYTILDFDHRRDEITFVTKVDTKLLKKSEIEERMNYIRNIYEGQTEYYLMTKTKKLQKIEINKIEL